MMKKILVTVIIGIFIGAGISVTGIKDKENRLNELNKYELDIFNSKPLENTIFKSKILSDFYFYKEYTPPYNYGESGNHLSSINVETGVGRCCGHHLSTGSCFVDTEPVYWTLDNTRGIVQFQEPSLLQIGDIYRSAIFIQIQIIRWDDYSDNWVYHDSHQGSVNYAGDHSLEGFQAIFDLNKGDTYKFRFSASTSCPESNSHISSTVKFKKAFFGYEAEGEPDCEITRPEDGVVYRDDNVLFSGLPITIVVGSITVEVDAPGADKVEFELGSYSKTDNSEPFSYKFTNGPFGILTLYATAYYDGEQISDSLRMLALFFHI